MADDPLAGLIQSIKDASIIPAPTPYNPTSEDPFFRLLNNEKKETRATISEPPAKMSGELSTMSGNQLSTRTRQAISNRPLSGKSRIEAVDLALAMLENPTKAKIEKVLEILISG